MEHSENLKALLKKDEGDDVQDKIVSLYSEIFGYFDEAIKVTTKEKKDAVKFSCVLTF